MNNRIRGFALSLVFLLAALAAGAQSPPLTPIQQLARDIFRELVQVKSTETGVGSTPAAEAVARRLLTAGYAPADVQVIGASPHKQNVVARLRGSGKQRPMLLIAHLDVVEARREDWSRDPFTLVEKEGYFYGRGTSDIKDGAAILAANFIRWKQAGYVPDRDLILALTADEETGGSDNGIDWLLRHHRHLIDAEYCLNTDSGDFQLQDGKPHMATVQASEKYYVDWRVEVRNRGGHSSLPRPDNAIYQLAHALARLEQVHFPVQLNEVSRAFLLRHAQLEGRQRAADLRAVAEDQADADAIARLSQDPYLNAVLRTTCVATRLEGGHAPNALPQTAAANINCRVVPGMPLQQVRDTLIRAIADPEVSLQLTVSSPESPVSPLRPEVVGTLEKVVNQMWPALPVVPVMETGGTDGRLLRAGGIPTYGVSGVFIDMNDVRAHGRDERIPVKSFYDGLEFYDRLVRALTK